ncbi:hypothetical protein [Roseivirga pacifica]|uniref:hypothetical protein n=1 Tax=Roseivirga pacifica TaxID=1267423 RepID=UPI002095A5AD|nr:hypothetical protein [Roseivirga pacifica]MCO6367769.1 hypothetical protein [Roseivirga pacifica]
MNQLFLRLLLILSTIAVVASCSYDTPNKYAVERWQSCYGELEVLDSHFMSGGLELQKAQPISPQKPTPWLEYRNFQPLFERGGISRNCQPNRLMVVKGVRIYELDNYKRNPSDRPSTMGIDEKHILIKGSFSAIKREEIPYIESWKIIYSVTINDTTKHLILQH